MDTQVTMTHTLMTHFGNYLAYHRNRLELTQGQLSEKSGVGKSMISKIENGKSGTKFETIEKLIDALDIERASVFSITVEANSSHDPAIRDLLIRLERMGKSDLDLILRLADRLAARRN